MSLGHVGVISCVIAGPRPDRFGSAVVPWNVVSGDRRPYHSCYDIPVCHALAKRFLAGVLLGVALEGLSSPLYRTRSYICGRWCRHTVGLWPKSTLVGAEFEGFRWPCIEQYDV